MISALWQKASSITETIDSFGPGAKEAASYVQDEVLAKIGQKRTMRTPQGIKEIVELGPLGNSLNVSKVRCLTTDKEYCLKRMALGNMEKDGNSKAPAERAMAMVSLEALQLLADKAEFLPNMSVHQNVVKTFSAHVDNTSRSHGQVFLMELCEESLAERIESQGPMSAEEVLKMIKDVAEGLQFLHCQKEGPVIHGSVEAAHVLKGKGGEYKLASFGATHFDAESPGSPKVKSDIWQLGILIFMSLFGLHPFGGEGEKSEAANSLKKGCALAVPHGRPKSLLEGRLCILMHWLLVPDACLRPTAKQVSVLLGHLEKMVASQLIKALPPPVQKTVFNTMKGGERQTLVDGLDAIPTHIGRNLVREFGEGLLLNPKLIPQEKLNQLMPRAVMSRIKELQTLYGLPDGAKQIMRKPKEAKQDSEQSSSTAKATKYITGQSEEAEEEVEIENEEAEKEKAAPADLMAGEDKKLKIDVTEAKEAMDALSAPTVDLMDFSPKVRKVSKVKEEKTMESSDLLDVSEATPEAMQTEQEKTKEPSDLLEIGDVAPEGKQTQDAACDLLDFGDDKPKASETPAGDLLDIGFGEEPPTSAPPAVGTSDLDILDLGMGPVPELSQTPTPAAVPTCDLDVLGIGMESASSAPVHSPMVGEELLLDAPSEALTAPPAENCNPFDVDFSGPAMPATTPMVAPVPAPTSPVAVPMMAGYPAMADTLAASQGNPFSQNPASQGNPFAAPAPQGNPLSTPIPQGNPFGAPADLNPAANPFEENHDDAFAFAVSNLKGKMSGGQ